MADEPPKEPKARNWLTMSVLGAAAGVAVYVFTIGSEIGAMRHKLDTHDIRIDALETRGSGPVQATAEKVNGLTSRADRILTELLAMQQRIADLQATQQSQGVVLERMQRDMAPRTPGNP
jgi:hypothetical protein